MAEGGATPALLTAEDEQTVRDLLAVREYDSRMGAIGHSLLNGVRHGLGDLPELLHSLNQRGREHWPSRALAALAVRYVDLDGIPAEKKKGLSEGLEGALRDKLGEPARSTYGRWAAVGAIISCVVSLFIFGGVGLSTVALVFMFTLMTCLFSLLVACVIEPLAARQVARVRGEAARSLAAIGAKESLRSILAAGREGAGSMSYYLAPSLMRALEELLPQFTSEDYGRVPAEVQAHLCDLLNHKDAELALAVLEMLRVCGTGSAVTSVETIRSWGRSEAVRARAAEVLPVLQERLAREQEHVRLLRATQGPGDGDGLLRAASGQTAADEPLLRVVEEGRS